jgi:hypothetical protein
MLSCTRGVHKSSALNYAASFVIGRIGPFNKLATHALVESLGRVVFEEFFYQMAKMSLPENHEVIEAFVLNCLNKLLCARIAGLGEFVPLVGEIVFVNFTTGVNPLQAGCLRGDPA